MDGLGIEYTVAPDGYCDELIDPSSPYLQKRQENSNVSSSSGTHMGARRIDLYCT
jgi:hypothetical protein